MILSESAHVITQVFQSPLSTVWMCKYGCCDLVRRFLCYHSDLVRILHQLCMSPGLVTVILSEALHAMELTFSEHTVNYQSQYMYFTDCQSNHKCRFNWKWNDIWLVYIYCIQTISGQINYILYTWTAICPYCKLLSSDPTVKLQWPSVVLATVPVLDLAGFIGPRGNGLTPSKIDDFLSAPSN